MNNWIVVTSINSPTHAIKKISEMCNQSNWNAVVVADKKTPKDWSCSNIHFFSVDEQSDMFGDLAELIPYNHYSRKNLGYLFAIKHGADIILETDDDNIPYATFGDNIKITVEGKLVSGEWVNVYSYFTNKVIWPRGLPLDEIHNKGKITSSHETKNCSIQQFLANDDPDVDAIYRLINKEQVKFSDSDTAVILEENSWCPFNSQNTIFFKEAFHLLYLPCFVSFRMTDIWRSFVAQACLWSEGSSLVFLPPTVSQIRNEHDLIKDFKDEIDGYCQNKEIISVLLRVRQSDKFAKLNKIDRAIACWDGLIDSGIVPQEEKEIIVAWYKALSLVSVKNILT